MKDCLDRERGTQIKVSKCCRSTFKQCVPELALFYVFFLVKDDEMSISQNGYDLK